MNVLLIGGLSNEKFISKTSPLLSINSIKRIYLFRNKGNTYVNDRLVKTLPFCKKGTKTDSFFPRILFDIYNFLGYSFFLLFKKIDIIIGIYLYPHGFYASLLGKIFSKPVILILPGSDLKKLLRTEKHIQLFKRAKFIGLRGKDSINKMVSLGFDRNRLFVLNNVFKINEYKYDSDANKRYDLIYTGFLRKEKRIDVILSVIRELKKEIPQIKFLIFGDGKEKLKLLSLVKELELEDGVEFKSFSRPFDNILKQSKVFIYASYSEGLPMSIIEAMSCGLPVVVSDINDIPDVVENGYNGYLVNPGDVSSYKKYCHILLKDEKKRQTMGKQARLTIEKLYKTDYSFSAVSNVWSEILQKTISEN